MIFNRVAYLIVYIPYLFLFVYFRTMVLIALFSQYLSEVKIPVPGYKKERGGLYVGRFPLFRLFPVSTGTHSVTSQFAFC